MQLLWFLTSVSLCLQLALTRTLQSIENNQDSDNEKTLIIPLNLVYGGFHYAEIGIGTPPQKLRVFFDTWNQNTWITSTKCPQARYPMCRNHIRYDAKKSTSSNETTEEFSYFVYETTVSGTITEDIVTLGGESVRQPFGEAMMTDLGTLDNVVFDGTFGIGFGSTGNRHPTILQSLKDSGVIQKQVFGIYAKGNTYGEIMFGGYNRNLYTSELEFTAVLSPQRWMFNVKSIMFGDEELAGETRRAIVNYGSHHIYGPTEEVKKIYKRLLCDPIEVCEVDCSKISTFPDLKIIVSKTEFTISPQDYIDREGDKCTGRIFDHRKPFWVLGNLFLDKAYTAYDVENSRIGFAQAKSPLSTLSPTPRSTSASTPRSTATQPTTTSAAFTVSSPHISMELAMFMAVLRYLQLYTP